MSKYRFTSAALVCAALSATLVNGRDAEARTASGGGTLVRPVPLHGDEDVETLGFNAQEISEGVAQGQIHYRVKTDGKLNYQSQLQVDWMLFVAENFVLIGGTVTNDTNPEYVGTTAVFIVRDNGEGGVAPPDERSKLFYGKDLGVNQDYEGAVFLIENGLLDPEEFLIPIERGNFQVGP